MAFEAGFRARLLQGDYALSAWTDSITAVDDTTMLDITTHETSPSKQFIPGMTSGNISVSGVMDVDGAATSLLGQENTWKGGIDEPLTFGHKGFAFGSELLVQAGIETSFASSSTVAGRVEFSLAAERNGLASANGVSLHDLTAETTTSESAEFDSGAGTTAGAIGHLHVTAFSGFTNIIIKIQTATSSGGSYSDLVTFATVTGVTSERVVVSGTVNRWVKAVWTKTGTGSCTFAVGFARL